jgi:hypothetical protein
MTDMELFITEKWRPCRGWHRTDYRWQVETLLLLAQACYSLTRDNSLDVETELFVVDTDNLAKADSELFLPVMIRLLDAEPSVTDKWQPYGGWRRAVSCWHFPILDNNELLFVDTEILVVNVTDTGKGVGMRPN